MWNQLQSRIKTSTPRFPVHRSTFAAALALTLLLLSFPGAARGEEERWEVMAERTVETKTFAYGDGSVALHSGYGPLHFADPGSGELLDIDPTLIAEDGWRNDTNSFPTELPQALGDGSALRLGPDLGVSWRPGELIARLISGTEVSVAAPSVAWGSPSEELPNAVTYGGLYPGLDLRVEVARGAVRFEMVLREWLLPFEPEQIDHLFLDAELEIPFELLEAAEERSVGGEALEELPLYLGRAGDEYVIALWSDPGLPEPHLEANLPALFKDPQGGSAPAPAGWRSTLGDWLATGRVRHAFRYPLATFEEEFGGGVGTAPSALTAAFKITAKEEIEQRRFFGVLNSGGTPGQQTGFVTISKTVDLFGDRHPQFRNRAWVGKGDNYAHLALVYFEGLKTMGQSLQGLGSWQVQEVKVGKLQTFYRPPKGIVAIESDGAAAGRVVHLLKQIPGTNQAQFRLGDWNFLLDQPYSLTSRPIPGGTLQTGTWDLFANAGATVETIAGDSFLFAPLSNTPAGSAAPRAVTDLTRVLTDGRQRFLLALTLPQDDTTCVPCTDAHSDPAVQALAGDYRVGAGFYDFRLEVRARATVSHTAAVSVTSVGGHPDQLFPGESLDWDLELTSISSGAGDLELSTLGWTPGDGVVFSFHDPVSPATVVPNPKLTAVGDKVRLRATWQRASPALYGKTQEVSIDGVLSAVGRVQTGQVKIPIQLKAPTGQPTFQQIYTVFDDNVSAPMGLSWVKLPSQPRGAALGEARLRHASGPTQRLARGVHWDLWSSATTSQDGEVVIYPDRFAPGMYTVELDPCLLPAGLVAPLHCATAQNVTFEIRAASTPSAPKPRIDFVAPWSVPDPSGGATTVSVHGAELGGTGASVTIPQVVTGATPVAGSTAIRVHVPVTLSGGTVCGPRQLTLTTPGGSATATFNVTKPFAGSPRHFVTEVEGAVLRGLTAQTLTGASGGQVVGIASAGAPGSLELRFRVPGTSSTYQLYALYGTPEFNASRADVTVTEGGNTVKAFKIALPKVAAGRRALSALYDATTTGPPTLLTLEAGKTYELEISSRPGQRYPLLDMLILSDGTNPPNLKELCF